MGFTPPSPDTLVDESGFTPPPPESFVDERGFTPPTPESLVPNSESSFVRRALGDTGIALAKGVVGVPESMMGLMDIQSLGLAGKVAEKSGVDFKFTRNYLDSLLSPEQQAANKAVSDAKGVLGTAGAILQNPSTIVSGVAESVPSMIGAGGLSRLAVKALPRLAKTVIGRVVAGAVGEGAVTAGSQAEQSRQASESGYLAPREAAIAVGSGAATGALGILGGKVARKLGIADIDTMMAGGATIDNKKVGIVLRVLKGMAAEGVTEELPQSAQEQIAQNIAAGKPWDEGVKNAAVMGGIIGSVMGGGTQMLPSGKPVAKPPVIPPVAEPARFPLPEEAVKKLDAVPVDQPSQTGVPALDNVNAQLAVKSAAEQQVMAEASQKQAADAAIQEQAAGKLVDEFGKGPIQFVDESKPIEALKEVIPSETKAVQEGQEAVAQPGLDQSAKPVVPAPVSPNPVEAPAKPANEPAQPGAVPPVIENTGLKHAIDELERTAYGFGERPQQDKQAMAVAWDKSGEIVKEKPLAGKQLADSLIANPRRGLTGDESALLLRHKVALENSLNEAAGRTKTGDPEARVEYDRLHEEFKTLLDAINSRGSEWGREGRWRQALAAEDYSFATQELRLVAAKGGEALTELEHQNLVKEVEKYKALLEADKQKMAQLDARETAVAAEEARIAATEQVTKETAKERSARKPATAASVITYLDEAAQAARDRIKARGGSLTFNASPLSEIPNIKDWAIIGASHIAKGIVKTAWNAKMILEHGKGITPYLDGIYKESLKEHAEARKTHGTRDLKAERDSIVEGAKEAVADNAESPEIGRYAQALAKNYIAEQVKIGRNSKDITGEEIDTAVHSTLKDLMPMSIREARDAWTGYGDYKNLDVSDPVKVRYREARAEQQKLSTLENLLKGLRGKKTGSERQAETDLTRRRQKQINELKKQLGFTETGPNQLRSVLDAIHTRNKNLIADLRYENSTRQRIVKEKRSAPFDAESVGQRAAIELLRQENRDIFGKRELTDEQRLELAIKSAERSEVLANEQLARAQKGDFSRTNA
jgi:hypothetical protein